MTASVRAGWPASEAASGGTSSKQGERPDSGGTKLREIPMWHLLRTVQVEDEGGRRYSRVLRNSGTL